jgi:transcription factor CRZ1
MSDMSPPPAHTPTPPHMLQSDGQQSSSAHHSPVFNQQQFQRSPGHSRNASLAPESAAFPQGQAHTEWSMMPPQFTTHRRSPSEYSDVSVSSAAPSPNLVQHDAFDSIEQHHSPLIPPQDPSGYQEVLGISNFTLSDPQRGASPRRGLSPAHTPAISPRLGPQQAPMIPQQNAFMLNMGMSNNAYVPSSGPDAYAGQSQEAFGQPPRNGSAEMGQAQQMVPPEINVEFAPASRQNSFEPPKPLSFDQDALTPPERGKFYYNVHKF